MDKDHSVKTPVSPPMGSRANYVREFSLAKVPVSFVDKLSMDFLALATKQSVKNLYFSRPPPQSSKEGGGGSGSSAPPHCPSRPP